MKKEKIQALEKSLCKLLQEREIKKIKVMEICNDANVSRSAFYTYFDDIYSLVTEIEDRIMDDVAHIMKKRKGFDFQNVKRGDTDPLFLEICRYCYNNLEIYKAMFCAYGNPDFVHRYERAIFEDFMLHIDGETNIQFPELVASTCSGAVVWLCRTWFSDITLATPEEIAQLHTNVVYKGILLPNIMTESSASSPQKSMQRESLWPISDNWGTTQREEWFWKY